MRPIADFEKLLAERSGLIRTRDARQWGFTTHGIRRAVEEGIVERVRTQRLAAPGCDPVLRMAAQAGGRVTCLTAAARFGLWTPAHDETHIVVPASTSRLDGRGLRVHWARGPVPVPAGDLTDGIINVLFHVARCVPRRDALAVWESALRTRKADAAVLARIEWRSQAARELAAAASVLSDSGIETGFLVLMRTLRVSVRQQVRLAGHHVDALIGERLVVQLDGLAHHQAADRRRDIRHDAELVLRGYTVLRFDYYQVLFEPDEVMAAVATAMAQGLHR